MSKFLLLSLPNAFHIQLGDKLTHPVFGTVKVQFISKEVDDFILTCELLDFNRTIKRFQALDFIRIQQGKKTRLKVVRDERS